MLPLAAKERMLANLKKGGEKPVVELIPQREAGKARDQAAKLTGTNGRYVSIAKRLKEVDLGSFLLGTALR